MQIQTPYKVFNVVGDAFPWKGGCDYVEGSCCVIHANEIQFMVRCNEKSPEPGRLYTVVAAQYEKGQWKTVGNKTFN